MSFVDQAFRLMGEIGMKHSFLALVDLSVPSSPACHSTVLLTGIVFAGCKLRRDKGPRKALSDVDRSILSSFWV